MPSPPAAPSPLDLLLEHLKHARGFDFTGYKRSSLERRIAKRMEAVGAADHTEYRDRLELDPDEFARLFDTVLVNVTAFFRDPPVWEHMAEVVIPELLAAVGPHGPIRVWCAGCSSGEEPYTVAILLCEALGPEAYLERVKIYATDVDEDALAEARAASYTDRSVEAVPAQLLDAYFERTERRHAFRKDLRRTVIFGRNDLVQDAPISRIDLLTCRNTLIYFSAETQGRILERLHFALNDTGVLLAGRSEMLVAHSDRFVPVDVKRRVFAPVVQTAPRRRPVQPLGADPLRSGHGSVRALAFDAGPTAQVVVDAEETIVAINRQARIAFGLSAGDVGRPLRDLELSFRPADLRSNLELARRERRTVALGPMPHTSPAGDHRSIEVLLSPVVDEGVHVGATVSFTDVTVQQHLSMELETSRAELGDAYEELQSTVEELETTNEELQSTNEELETTNEELQSTNEELETMNEELESTNEELETTNDELRTRTGEVDDVNGFLQAILATMETGVVVVDARLEVLLWNGQAEELLGLRHTEVRGQGLLDLDTGLPFAALEREVRDVLGGGSARKVVEVAAMNRRGRSFDALVTVLPLAGPGRTYGAILLIAEAETDAAPPAPRAADASV